MAGGRRAAALALRWGCCLLLCCGEWGWRPWRGALREARPGSARLSRHGRAQWQSQRQPASTFPARAGIPFLAAHVLNTSVIGWLRWGVCEPRRGKRLDASSKLEVPPIVCQVEAGDHGAGENRTELHVYKVPEAPEITANKGGVSVKSRHLPQIATCVSRNSFPPPNITWYKNREQLHTEENKVKVSETVTRESSWLYTVSSSLFASVTREDRSSLFHCAVHYWLSGQQRTMESQNVSVNVFYPAEHVTLLVLPSPAFVKEGDNVQLVCKADGNPAPMFSFYKRELEDNWQDLSSLADANSGVLNLHDVNKSSSGLYRCQALDLDDMEQLEKDVELVVNCNSPLYVRQDEVVNLTCKAIAFPQPSVQWNINGTTHEYMENQHIASNLTVRVDHNLLQAGAMCRVTNALGTSEKHIQLLDHKMPESKGVIIVAIIVSVLVVAVLGSVIYFLYKKGKIPCGRAGKQDM
ncbi:Cell surface glycoprotein MUC18 [Tinamus guttatus]|uniref:Cell surface glycoprotein MUC18 n=1 Tax=Tinamus guttatus TaxID=94827 RepID=A0A099ZHZ0_TINGU|nr:Cell surface glycoprotein MUC18 [Tinamus guttatus]